MEYEKYTSIMREFQEVLLQYIDNEEDTEEIYQNLIKLFQEQKISENPPELLLIIQQIVHIANYHHRSHNFFLTNTNKFYYISKKRSIIFNFAII